MKTSITQAVKLLQAGDIVALPTETIYGLAGDALNPEAVKKIYASKGRPSQNPLIVHIAKVEDVEALVHPPNAIEKKLMEAFWPGPLTLILQKKPHVPEITSGGLDTLALRMPAHPIMQKILLKTGLFLAAPSANPSGRISPTHHVHVEEMFQNSIPTLYGGLCPLGVESSVVKVEKDKILLLREGALSIQELEKASGLPVEKVFKDARSPGSHFKHYAPISPIFSLSLEEALQKNLADFCLVGLKEDLLALARHQKLGEKISLGTSQKSAQNKFYASLFCADQSHKNILVIQNPKLGATLLERLARACEA